MRNDTKRTVVVVILAVLSLGLLFYWLTGPSSSGGSSSAYVVGPEGRMVVVSESTWNNKGEIRRIGHHVQRINSKALTRATVGPCYRVEAEVHGDARHIDKVVQGFGHFKLCMQAGDHTKVNDAYSSASSSHRETWLWSFDHVDLVTGAGVSTHWCNGGIGPCLPVEYRYWRYTFSWKQGVSIFGQDIAHHKTLYIGCTLRAGPGGFQCGTGEA
jgi:hypothetical protein